MKYKDFIKKTLNLLERLSSPPKVGGLQISNSAIRFVLINKGKSQATALRLTPGTIKEGRVQDRNAFITALNNLHQIIIPDQLEKEIRVIVTLPAELVYTKSFSVPNIDKKILKESAQLNLKMISPIPVNNAYTSWQIISETNNSYELLGAFAEKAIVNEFLDILEEAKFFPMAFEFPALALTRVVNKTITLKSKPVLVFHLSSDGLNLSILKNGALYFDYFRSWQSIQGDQRQITKSAFEEVLINEVQKVINFNLSRFKENLGQVILSAPGFENEVKTLLENQFQLEIMPLQVRSFASLDPQMLVALGSALRGLVERSKDILISLSPISSVEEFYREQTISFIRLWRNVFASVFLLFLIIFSSFSLFLVNFSNKLQAQLDAFKSQAGVEEFIVLQEQAQEFNRLVGLISEARGANLLWPDFFNRIQTLADKYDIILGRLSIVSAQAPINLVGQAPSNTAVIKFKNTLADESLFVDVNLPLSSITTLEDNSVSFSLSFSLNFEQNE